jgi:uncharacterized protein (DUF2384 family)
MKTHKIRLVDYKIRGTASAEDLLRQAACAHFPSTEAAELWLRAANPKLDRRRPIEVAVDQDGLNQCVRTLQKPKPKHT